MDRNKRNRSVLESSNNTSSGYSIEYSNTTYEHTLDERIQAAKTASSISKQPQKRYNKEKFHYTNNRTIALEEDTHDKNKIRQSKIDFSFRTNMPSTITKSINMPVQTKYNIYESLPAYKGGGLMQRRLESIKANKKLTTIPLKCDDITKSANFPNNRSNLHETLTNNHVSDQFNINDSKRYEFKSRNKNGLSEIGHYDRTKSIANTSSEHILDERIQAAKTASSISKQPQKRYNKEKFHYTNNRTIALEEDTHDKNKIGQSKIDFSFRTNMPSTITKSINTPVQTKYNIYESLPACKGGGLMQRRLESIKANKKLTTIPLKCDDITKSANFPNNRSNLHETLTNNHVSDQFNINDSKCNAFKSRNKNGLSEIGHYDRTKSIANTSKKSESSIQNRLIRAKEEMKAKSQSSNQNNVLQSDMNKNLSTHTLSSVIQDKLTKVKDEMKTKSKLYNQNSVSKIDSNKKPFKHTSGNIHQNTNILVHNIKNKNKRLMTFHSNQRTNKAIVSTAKKIIIDNSDVNQMISKQLITVQQKPIVPNTTNHTISHNPTGIIRQTVVSTKLENSNSSKNSSQKELDSFSFVLPQPHSAQSRLEQIKKIHINNDESMDWEEDIIESNQIVESVKDLRKTVNNYEPMEWTPDPIIYSDQINHCLVIDTNIFLSNLRSITVIIDKCLPEIGYITLVIPWQVLHELDFIKKNENEIGFRAREATRWLLEMLNKNHPQIKGQPMIPKKKKGVYADDSILDCALTLKSRVNSVGLITDDKMLSVKSQFNGIYVRNSVWLNNLTSVKHPSGSQVFQEAVNKYPIIENESVMKFGPYLEHFATKILTFSISQSMDYSNFSKKVLWRKLRPLNITNCLSKLKEHWNVITPHEIHNPPKKQIDWLIYFFEDFQLVSNVIVPNWNELYNLLKNCIEIINALPYEYYHITDILLNDLMKARKFLKPKLDCITSDDDEELSLTFSSNLIMSNDCSSGIDNILLNILKGVNKFCAYIYKANGFNLNLPENDSNCVLSKIVHSNTNMAEDYCHKLSNIIKVMLKIKKMPTEQIMKSHIIIDTFFKAIVEFDNDLIKLNKESLLDYVLMKDKNFFLNILISFQNNLASVKNLVTTIKF